VVQSRGTAIALGLLGVACGLTGVHAVRPAGSTVAQVTTPYVTTGDAATTAVGSPVHAPLDLTRFRPLLAYPEFTQARAHLDDNDPARAAAVVRGMISQKPVQGVEAEELQFLLGILGRAAGDLDAAQVAFEQASQKAWVLQEDAILHAAEVARERGKPDLALAALARLNLQRGSTRALSTEALSLLDQQKFDEAARTFKKVLSVSDSSTMRLQLSRALLASAEGKPPGETRKQLATEAAHEAEVARLGQAAQSAFSREVDAVLLRARSSGAVERVARTVDQELAHLRGLLDAKDFEEAATVAQRIVIPPSQGASSERCNYDYLVGKLLAGQRKWGEGADQLRFSAERCTADRDLHAALLFNAGKYAAADARHTLAVRYYADLERLHPQSSLADDARLRAAESFKKQGVAARFVSLLASMPEDYPDGDMTMEGVLTLALHRIERGDWSGAAQVLESGARVVRHRDSARGHEYSGTERYFLARAREQLGEEAAALSEYESIVRELPLSYYMLHAYSRLLEANPARAKVALSQGLNRAQESPFEFPHRPEYETAEFARGMALLRVGDTERGKALLTEIGLGPGADDALVWGIALLYDRAGDAHTSHGIARSRLTDWLAHYPEGSWKQPWEIGFPRPYHSFVERESRATGVPEWLIYGVMREESTFQPEVVSHADAYGLMQVIVPTARNIAKKSGHPYSPAALKRPDVNIAIGSRVLEELGRYFRENPWLAIPGYNAGPGRPKQWLRERPNVDFDVWVEMIPFRETRRYTKRVLSSRAAYAFLYHREDSQTALVLPKRLTPP
jgi:soluble lytic murein transglycosylase